MNFFYSSTFFFFPLSDIMDLRHQSSAMCIIMLGGADTHPWSATKVGNPIPVTIPADQEQKKQQTTQTSHYAVEDSGRFGKNMAADVSAKKICRNVSG